MISSQSRRRRLSADAAASRASAARRWAAITAVVVYNIVGVADILSTIQAIGSGAGVEANPLIRAVMESAGHGWILAKLALQGIITVMVLWFPHWIVIALFSLAIGGNMAVVYNNMVIGGVI